jgi:TusA-related sulfurtransferase
MAPGQMLTVILDRGEPEAMVVPGLEQEGHQVVVDAGDDAWISLKVTCGGD